MNQVAGPAPLVVFEGIDGSGKGTQASRLQARLNTAGVRAELLSFPRYQSTFFGARIGEFLNGELGALDQLDPFLISLLYAGDRFESRETLQQARINSEIVVLDRYVASNIAHQSAKATGERRRQLQSWIQQIEYDIFGLPRPTLVFLLDVPVETSQALICRKNQRSYTEKQTDLQEADVDYLGHVREVYLELAHQTPGWKLIPVLRDGQIRTVQDINDEIWAVVQSELSIPSL